MNFIPPIPNSLEQHWMPFTANRHFKANPRILTRAEGVYFTTDHGDKVIDGSSGLFCVDHRSEEHTSELQSLMSTSYAVFCLKKKKASILQIYNTLSKYNINKHTK